MDWGQIRQRCLEEGQRRGLARADAEDLAQEAVCLALTRGATFPLTYALRCVERAVRRLQVDRRVPGLSLTRPGHLHCEVVSVPVSQDLAAGIARLDLAHDLARQSGVVEEATVLLARQGRRVEDLEPEELPELLEAARGLTANRAWAGASMGCGARVARTRARDRALARLAAKTPPIT